MNLPKIFKIFHNIYIRQKYHIKRDSYSSEGEDKILDKFLKNINNGFYVDVGAYHPIKASNTLLLFQKGWSGINIDPSKFSIDLFNFLRPKDENYNFAISNKKEMINFYYGKSYDQLATASNKFLDFHFKKKKIKYFKKKIRAHKLNYILDKSKFNGKKIDLLNIDVQGYELKVLKSLNFKKYYPSIICIEIELLEKNEKLKKTHIYKFLKKRKYIKKWSGLNSHIFVKKYFNS
tara:strand:- start:7134 stop:7835 length:702 start_codon:yes stop_codon:yes gene_type:complete